MRCATLMIAGMLGMTPIPAMASAPAASANLWLLGDWILCKDPDRSPKDTLRFESDGTGWVLREKRNVELVYRLRGERLEMLANASGKVIPITMTFTASRDLLQLHNDKTGKDSTYVSKDGPRIGECDA